MTRRGFPVLAAALLLAACTAPPPSPSTVAAPPSGPEDWRAPYRSIARDGRTVLDVDPSRSIVAIDVRRGGRLAELGHDHVVASRSVRGLVAPADGRADLEIPLVDLVVDDPALRRAAGLSTTPTAADVEGTRANMLERVLHVERHAAARASLTGVDARPGSRRVAATVTLNGVTREVPLDLAVETVAGGVRGTGRATLRQTDFGIVPFSILGGAIAVEDALVVRFDITAKAAAP